LRPEGAESTLSLALILVLALQSVASEDAAPVVTAPAPAVGGLVVEAPRPPRPRNIDDRDQPLNGAVPQGEYESRVQGAVSRSQSLLGPLDGGWIVEDGSGAALFRFQLVDRGFAAAALEGVWSDQRVGGADGRGFFSAITRSGATVTLRFVRPGGATTLTLEPRPAGGFSGSLTATAPGQPEQRTAVVMRRP
jgi:hypothetical protein